MTRQEPSREILELMSDFGPHDVVMIGLSDSMEFCDVDDEWVGLHHVLVLGTAR